MSNSNLKTFRWKGKNQFGQSLKGQIEATDSSVLALILKRQGIISTRIYPVYSFRQLFSQVKQWFVMNKKHFRLDVLFMLRQLSMLLSAHVPLVQALQIIEGNQHNPPASLKKVLEDCRLHLQAGHTLAESFRRHSRYFSDFFCRWIEAGEYSGTLDILLEHWIVYREQHEQVRQKLKKALTYPCFILVTAMIVAMILVVWVIPVFEKLFHQMNAELPLLTQCVMMLAIALKKLFIPFWFFIGILFLSMRCMRGRFPKLWFYWDKLLLKIPFIGMFIQDVTLARFTRTLTILLTAGFTLSDALQWTSTVMNNRFLTQLVLTCQQIVISGTPLSQAMDRFGYFSPLCKQMVAVGEASGTLDKTLSHTAIFYEKKISYSLEKITEVLEPLMMIIIGGVAGIFILAMYLPIFKLGALF